VAGRARGAWPHAQHFLRSSRLAADIVRSLDVRFNELVVEVGAGTGRLTAELAKHADRVVAIEIDPELCGMLRRRFPQIDVLEGDAVRVSLPQEPYRVVGNLPFNRTTAILRRFLDDPRVPLVRVDVIVEWEFARKRAAVWPSSVLGLVWSAWYELVVVRHLPRRAFEPAPSVDAALLRIMRRSAPLVDPTESTEFSALVGAAFARGSVRAVVPGRVLKRMAGRLGFDAGAAPRELDVHQWAALYRTVSAGGGFKS